MMLFRCKAVDVHFAVHVLFFPQDYEVQMQLLFDVILCVLAEVVLVEVLKFDCLLDEVLLKLLFSLVDVGGYL